MSDVIGHIKPMSHPLAAADEFVDLSTPEAAEATPSASRSRDDGDVAPRFPAPFPGPMRAAVEAALRAAPKTAGNEGTGKGAWHDQHAARDALGRALPSLHLQI